MKKISQDLAELRREYLIKPLRRAGLEDDPLRQFDAWFHDARTAEAMDANAMMLATADRDGQPTARTVLLKSYDDDGFVFYTNLESHKARDIANNDKVTLLFYWHELHRQIRIDGIAARTPTEEDERYFRRRPRESQLSAWASPQSRVLDSRQDLEDRVAELTASFADRDVELPPFWGGYRVSPQRFEFWQGRENRLHDRFLYSLERPAAWRIERLGP